nr:hypothetical protein [Tanacetum cinerariifolium]
MSTFFLCVGYGEPLYGFSPCQWCTYEWCGNDLLDGFCSLCNSRNSCVYETNSNSFDCPPDSYHPPHPTYETYSCDSCGNDSHFGHDCQPQFPLNYESKPGYIENYNSYPYDSSSFPQQYLCCENCGVSRHLSTSSRNEYPINGLKQQHLDEMKCLINSEYRDEIKIDELKGNFNSISIEINKKEKLQQLEQVANLSTYPSKRFNSFCYDDEDDEDYTIAITPNEFIKSSVENLVSIPSESEGESECDVPAREEFTTFSNILFDAEYEFDSSDDQSFSDEDVPKKIFLKPLFDEEIIHMKIKQHHYNAESDLIESLRTHDSSIIILSKIDSLFDEFVEFVSGNSDTKIESFSPSPIPVEDSDSLMKAIDLSFNPDYLMLPGIEDDDYDSERDILILKDLLSNDTISLPEIESFHFDIPSFSRPPAKPLDGNTEILNVKMMGDISDQKVSMPKLMITLVPNQEKSHDLLSHQGLEAFQPSAKCPMMIHEKNTPILDVLIFHFYPP